MRLDLYHTAQVKDLTEGSNPMARVLRRHRETDHDSAWNQTTVSSFWTHNRMPQIVTGSRGQMQLRDSVLTYIAGDTMRT